MTHQSAWQRWGTWLGFVLLALAVPIVIAYDLYDQIRTPVIDFDLDWQSGEVRHVPQDSYANYAGLMTGDIILSADGVAFDEWRSLSVGNYNVTVQRGETSISVELPVVAMAKLNLGRILSAVGVGVFFWASSVLLLIRQRKLAITRLLYLIGLFSAITVYYPLAHVPPWINIAGPLSISRLSFYWLAPLTLHLYLSFPILLGTTHQRRWGLGTVYALAFLAMLTSLSGSPVLRRIGEGYTILLFAAAMASLVYAYFSRATPEDRRRLRLIFFSALLAIVPASVLFFVPGMLGWDTTMPVWLVGLLLLAIPLSYMYAINRHNLFGIDHLLNRAIVYGVLSLGILLLYLGPFLIIYRFVPGDLLAQTMVAAGLTLLVGLAFGWTREQVQRVVDGLFYGGWYDYPRVIERASDGLTRSLDRAQVVDVLTRQVPEMMQLQPGRVWIGEASQTSPGKSKSAQSVFSFQLQGECQAFWQVGERRDGEAFSETDQRILTTLAHQAEIALNNALLVEQLRQQLDEIRASREALTQTQHQLMRSREEERTRLARDLHDGPLQSLVGMNLQLGLLLAQSPQADPGPLENLRAEVRSLLGELRQVCSELRPPMLDTLGLGAALRSLIEDWSSQNGITVHHDLPSDAALRGLPNEVAINLYRVAQEALSNIARHAAARQISLRLAWDGACLTMSIRDDGQGFAVPNSLHTLTHQGHFGLTGMKERMELIGGNLNLKSLPDSGTAVQITWKSPP